MAYRLKSVRYQNSPRKILLQNENGPCPLLACANALLLRGVISLPASCVRSGVASIDDVVNLLGERALKRAADQREAAASATEWKVAGKGGKGNEKGGGGGVETDGGGGGGGSAPADPLALHQHHQTHEHHIHELLSLFPNLQYGMDVNPKFNQGPTGVEYTMNITAFDLLGVDLVHGWLLDPQDIATLKVVGSRSYNELVELVIIGNEARAEVKKLAEDIKEKEEQLEAQQGPDGKIVDLLDDAPPLQDEDDGALSEEERTKLEKELEEMRAQVRQKSAMASNGVVANDFLTTTGHQLTYHGLHELHNHVAEECLCVFFRNNHFATMTKHEGVLYLLVTDLGYANVSEIVWEKLDSINGDTELFDEYFARPAPRKSLAVADGPVLSPEALLAQRGRSEADYQLALQLSGGKNGKAKTRAEMDDEEGKLIAAATEASLREWNGTGKRGGLADVTIKPGEKADMGVPMGTNPQLGVNDISGARGKPDTDHAVALALQAQLNADEESERLARKLQDEENRAAEAGRRQQRGGNGGASPMTPDRTTQSKDSSCVIS